MTHSLRKRQEDYESDYDFKIQKRLPIAIKVTLKNYKRLTQNLDKPFCEELSEVMGQTALFIISQIQDAVFGYCQNDEIVFVLRNDKTHDNEPWCGNNLQKIVSSVSSLATIGFKKSVDIFGDDLDLVGDGLFVVNVFSLPYLAEAANYLVFRQGLCLGAAINKAVSYELDKKFGKRKAVELMKDTSFEEKIQMLLQYCGVDFYDYYLAFFIYGTAVYKIPVIVSTRGDDITKNKWYIDYNIPNFTKDKDFVPAILSNGADVFRAPDFIEAS